MRNTVIIGILFSSVLLQAQSVAKDSNTMLVPHYEEARRMSVAGPMHPATNCRSTSSLIRISTGVIGPTLISEPPFSISASDFGQQDLGTKHMIVRFWVDEHGSTCNIHVLKPVNPSIDERVMDAVRQYRFAPATLDNQRVAVEINMTVNFERR